jgi:hypothetical protein
VRRYYKSRMDSERANQGRWRRDLTVCDAKEIDELYAAALDRLEARGSTAVPLLRATMESIPPTRPAATGRIPASPESPLPDGRWEDLGGGVP